MLEIVRSGASAPKARVAILDFDGTLSLIRSGWMQVMIPLCVEVLAKTNSGESEDELRAVSEDLVAPDGQGNHSPDDGACRCAVALRGGKPLEPPIAYKRLYLERLSKRIAGRLQALESGAAAPEQYLVPGSRALLEALLARGCPLFPTRSGADDADVKPGSGAARRCRSTSTGASTGHRTISRASRRRFS